MKTILFVCTGNTCRSSMAGALAEDLIRKKGWDLTEFKIVTAGLAALPGAPASREAVEILKEQGLDLSYHRAQGVTAALVKEADLILAMTREHKDRLLSFYPGSSGKVFTLREYAGEGEVSDLAKRVEELDRAIGQKEKKFIIEHKHELDKLRQEYHELCARLSETEKRLADWEDRIRGQTEKERNELLELERQLAQQDVADPIGGPLEVYRQCALELMQAIGRALDKFDGEKQG